MNWSAAVLVVAIVAAGWCALHPPQFLRARKRARPASKPTVRVQTLPQPEPDWLDVDPPTWLWPGDLLIRHQSDDVAREALAAAMTMPIDNPTTRAKQGR